MIKAPFANYHRAKLERLVHEGFDAIERKAATTQGTGPWGNDPNSGPLSAFEFQVLMAADAYLKTTQERPKEPVQYAARR